MVRSVNIPDALYERLKKIAEEKGITVSAVIKMACKEYADNDGKK
jgi:predicted DNA-binding protein